MISLPHKSLAGVILAAGGSSRLGRSKQLCEWKGKPLICHAVEASLAVCGEEVVVVTGADATEVEAKLQSYSVQIARNMGWETGMAASLQTGVRQLRGGKITGVLVLLCDQPMISVDDLTSLVNVWNALPEHPAASQYGGVYGVPAIYAAVL